MFGKAWTRQCQTRKRKDLQLALHAHACNLRCTLSVQQACFTLRDPLRDEIREVGRGLSQADTQTGRYVRFYSRRRLCARRSSRRTAQDPPSTFQRLRLRSVASDASRGHTGIGTVLIPSMSRHSGGVLARALLCPRVYAICRPVG